MPPTATSVTSKETQPLSTYCRQVSGASLFSISALSQDHLPASSQPTRQRLPSDPSSTPNHPDTRPSSCHPKSRRWTKMSRAHASHRMFGTINHSGSKSSQGGIARALSLNALQFSTIPAGSMPSSEVLLEKAAEHAQAIQEGSQVRLPLRHPSDWLAVDLWPRDYPESTLQL